ncbi:MAG: WbuC family cupin fold metalloprotein [Bacteroidota bacterium]
MVRIDKTLLDSVTTEAISLPRLRKNFNFHKEYSDTLQRLLNALEPMSYIRPHKHEDPDKREVFFALRGRILVIEFDENGEVADHQILDPAEGVYGTEIPERTFHTIVSLESGTVAYEIKDGPYSPIDDKNFASWAPAEGSAEALPYLRSLIDKTAVRPSQK